ncbi:hypothetical protein PR003_g3118 [Phytophthora rubi]|uniref:Uncharacterized protein n=1 Tax=Phytophthora rubi TaxID=129364 RepID=A0A6A4G0A6_9STRA|nr:hypothetical protein PR003_g3118 [Phytophthora rubi]
MYRVFGTLSSERARNKSSDKVTQRWSCRVHWTSESRFDQLVAGTKTPDNQIEPSTAADLVQLFFSTKTEAGSILFFCKGGGAGGKTCPASAASAKMKGAAASLENFAKKTHESNAWYNLDAPVWLFGQTVQLT